MALSEQVAAGRFRADLYHRLAVLVLELPPLRARSEDILELAQTFLQRYAAAHGLRPKQLSPAAEGWLRSYDWPGNVRELGHLMERVTLLSTEPLLDVATIERLVLPRVGPPAPHAPGPLPASKRGPGRSRAHPAGAPNDWRQCGAGGAGTVRLAAVACAIACSAMAWSPRGRETGRAQPAPTLPRHSLRRVGAALPVGMPRAHPLRRRRACPSRGPGRGAQVTVLCGAVGPGPGRGPWPRWRRGSWRSTAGSSCQPWTRSY